MSTEDDTLNALYAQRQEILKKLSEVDASIKALEAQIQERQSTTVNALTSSDTQTVDTDVGKIHQLIAQCMQSSNGLRDALKVVDMCRSVQEEASVAGADVRDERRHFRDMFVHEAIACSWELAVDPNGSEVMQQIVPLLATGHAAAELHVETLKEGQSELMLLIQHLGDGLVPLCCNTNGARVSQRIVDCLTTVDEFEQFVAATSPSIMELAKDINGNHSLAKLMVSGKFKRLAQEAGDDEQKTRALAIHKAIYVPIEHNCIDICKSRQGCCIIQKCLQWAPEPYHAQIINKVLSNVLKLVRDPFGNYVIQFILDRQRDIGGVTDTDAEGGSAPNYTNQIIRQMLHHVADLSCNKFSSNVIEKCLKTASSDVRQLLVDELTEPQALPKLLTDSYANYVIQTAISTASDDTQFAQLRDSILPLQDLLKNSPYGVRIETKLSRRHRETARKQSKKKDTANTAAATAAPIPHQDSSMNMPFMSNIPTAIQVMSSDGSMGQQLTFTNVPPPSDMASFFQSQQMMNPMPFMLQGTQQLIGIHNSQPAPPYTAMNMIHSSPSNKPPPDYFQM